MAAQALDPGRYRRGRDRYVKFAEDFLGVSLAETQKTVLRALTQHQRILIVSGNGVGKSYVVAIAILAFLYTNPDSTVLGTSGSYSQFVDAMWRPLSDMHKGLKAKHGLPGEVFHGNRPRIEIDDNWYGKVVSPRDHGDLEGRHAEDVLVVIEEADKRYISEEHFDSAGSSITDVRDRMIAIGNPPEDESAVIYTKMRPESRWHVIQFSSFESHNVKVDAGEIDGDFIPGLVDLPTIAEDWEEWNDEPWPHAADTYEASHDSSYPGATILNERFRSGEISRTELVSIYAPGVEVARHAHTERTDLDQRWYRRRAGVIPPESARAYRPFNVDTIERAYTRNPRRVTEGPQSVAIDVARMGGDENVMSGKHGQEIRVYDAWHGVDHKMNKQIIRACVEGWSEPTVIIDAQGEGSGLADEIKDFAPNRIRFNSGEKATEETEFYDKWTEALYYLGKFFREGGSFSNKRLYEELVLTARIVEFNEQHYASRDSTVLKATPKEKVKEALGRSPDYLDSVLMVVWGSEDGPSASRRKQLLVW